jgi:hypothetical protein
MIPSIACLFQLPFTFSIYILKTCLIGFFLLLIFFLFSPLFNPLTLLFLTRPLYTYVYFFDMKATFT